MKAKITAFSCYKNKNGKNGASLGVAMATDEPTILHLSFEGGAKSISLRQLAGAAGVPVPTDKATFVAMANALPGKNVDLVPAPQDESVKDQDQWQLARVGVDIDDAVVSGLFGG